MLNKPTIDLQKLNSLTKYPSIPTYHDIGDKGILQDVCGMTGKPPGMPLGNAFYANEKIDGTNGRIVLMPANDAFIGSREELLTYSGDMIFNPAQQIAETLKELMQHVMKSPRIFPGQIVVIYTECYGGRISSNSKQYTANPAHRHFRMFDVRVIPNWKDELDKSIEDIAAERERNQKWFLSTDELEDFGDHYNIPDFAPLRAFGEQGSIRFHSSQMPVTIEDTMAFLTRFGTNTRYGIQGHVGRSEGVIIRNDSRTYIRKLRFEDYERTLRKKK